MVQHRAQMWSIHGEDPGGLGAEGLKLSGVRPWLHALASDTVSERRQRFWPAEGGIHAEKELTLV